MLAGVIYSRTSRIEVQHDKNGLLMQDVPIDGAVHKLACTSLQAWLPYQSHYSSLVGNLGEKGLYGTMRMEYYCLHMVNDVYMAVRNFLRVVRNNLSEKQWGPLQFNPANGPLEFFTMDILEAPLKTSNGTYFELVMTDRYIKLTKDVSTSKTTSPYNGLVFSNQRSNYYRIPQYAQTGNGTQSLSKLLSCFVPFRKQST